MCALFCGVICVFVKMWCGGDVSVYMCCFVVAICTHAALNGIMVMCVLFDDCDGGRYVLFCGVVWWCTGVVFS